MESSGSSWVLQMSMSDEMSGGSMAEPSSKNKAESYFLKDDGSDASNDKASGTNIDSLPKTLWEATKADLERSENMSKELDKQMKGLDERMQVLE